MVSAENLRSGMIIEYNFDIYVVEEARYIKPGKGSNFVRVRIKCLETGNTLTEDFFPSDRFGEGDEIVRRAKCEFMYDDGDYYTFMDTDTFEQFAVSKKLVGDTPQGIKEGAVFNIILRNGLDKVLSVEPETDISLSSQNKDG